MVFFQRNLCCFTIFPLFQFICKLISFCYRSCFFKPGGRCFWEYLLFFVSDFCKRALLFCSSRFFLEWDSGPKHALFISYCYVSLLRYWGALLLIVHLVASSSCIGATRFIPVIFETFLGCGLIGSFSEKFLNFQQIMLEWF